MQVHDASHEMDTNQNMIPAETVREAAEQCRCGALSGSFAGAFGGGPPPAAAAPFFPTSLGTLGLGDGRSPELQQVIDTLQLSSQDEIQRAHATLAAAGGNVDVTVAMLLEAR